MNSNNHKHDAHQTSPPISFWSHFAGATNDSSNPAWRHKNITNILTLSHLQLLANVWSKTIRTNSSPSLLCFFKHVYGCLNPIKMDDLGVPPFKETSISKHKWPPFILTIHASKWHHWGPKPLEKGRRRTGRISIVFCLRVFLFYIFRQTKFRWFVWYEFFDVK